MRNGMGVVCLIVFFLFLFFFRGWRWVGGAQVFAIVKSVRVLV